MMRSIKAGFEPTAEQKRTLMRLMLRVRRFEEKIVEVYGAQDMKTPVHLSLGQEAVSAGVCFHLKKEDYLFSTHRNHGHLLSKGAAMAPMIAEMYGLASGCSRGKGGSMHMLDPEASCLGTSAIVGGSIPLGAGAALAALLRGDGRIAVAFFGDGASEEGLFHETMNFASLKKLPVVFVCENNGYATNSTLAARQPMQDVARHAAAHGIPGTVIDGNDVLAVCSAAAEAVARARAGKGPSFIECKTYRWKGHVGPECDHLKGCRPKEELDIWLERCPVKLYGEKLIGAGTMSRADIDAMTIELDGEISAAWKSARSGPPPTPEDLYKDVYR